MNRKLTRTCAAFGFVIVAFLAGCSARYQQWPEDLATLPSGEALRGIASVGPGLVAVDIPRMSVAGKQALLFVRFTGEEGPSRRAQATLWDAVMSGEGYRAIEIRQPTGTSVAWRLFPHPYRIPPSYVVPELDKFGESGVTAYVMQLDILLKTRIDTDHVDVQLRPDLWGPDVQVQDGPSRVRVSR